MANLFTFIRLERYVMLLGLVFSLSAAAGQSMRVKDLGKLQGWRENALVGYGLVSGLAGTGDTSTNRATRQALSNVLAQFNLSLPPEQIQSRNVAVVMVSASLPPFAREGDVVDVSVSSSADARSLVGGTLLQTALKAANGRVYALAQGALSVGGYRYDANGNVVQKNHPTVGTIPGGAVVEVGVTAQMLTPEQSVMFVLTEADYGTASKVAQAINSQFGETLAEAHDASGILIQVPQKNQPHMVEFLARIENVQVDPDRRARVVINERTGTVVAGGDVRIAPVAIAHGDLKIAITTQNTASQPILVSHTGEGVRTAILANSQIKVEEQEVPGFVAPGQTTVADLMQVLAKMKINTRDMISILRALKAAGAMHAELRIQ